MKSIIHIYALCLMFSLCACIDENLSGCGETYSICYRLHANARQFDTQLSAQLPELDDSLINSCLHKELSPIFGDIMHDVSLIFYDEEGLSYQDTQNVNSTDASFVMYMPINNYRHHAVANIEAEPMTERVDVAGFDTHRLIQVEGNVIDSDVRGIYAGRLEISDNLQEFKDKNLSVDLYMVNCAAVLVLDLQGNVFDEISAQSSGFVDSFMLNDSIFEYGKERKVKARYVTDGGERIALYTVNMPSVKTARGEETWQMEVYVRKGETTTKNLVTSSSALLPGQLCILKGALDAEGRISTKTPNVAVSITLDWKEGSQWDIET